ncbi:C25 family cysteine peptidase [Dyadobacter sp. LHD-138]|uniref:putative type IX secretion system sortase PorU2 n=1 Tax=Dyadobacter sp. LHD-138 TaxID=3071413 RepID=UPI0027E11428|nr:C25 family cysteine peptidase [Dyadobacter sp. LHD-138]MDQ6478910.1 C25 family cysteine peptidase [Dyadobacter sp. LHD-138]
MHSILRYLGPILIFSLLSISELSAQWGAPYSNNWLKDQYNQPFVKVKVTSNGVYKIPISSLPAEFRTVNSSRLQLWHRGSQIDIISADNSEIIFYGVLNDGQSDELLYRSSITQPSINSRTNPYVSIYSDVSAYFLTIGPKDGNRALKISKDLDKGLTSDPYHLQTDILKFVEHYSHSPSINFITLNLVQSFLEKGKGLTSKIYGKNSAVTNPNLNGDPVFNLVMPNLYIDSNKRPELEILLYGRTTNSNNISVQIGKNINELRTFSDNINFDGFTDVKRLYGLKVSNDLSDSDVTNDGNTYLKLVSNKVTELNSSTGLYSVTYLKLSYPQMFNMNKKGKAVFNLLPTSNTFSRVAIKNAPENVKVFDVTDIHKPKVLSGSIIDGVFEVMVPRQKDQMASLLVTNEEAVITSAGISVEKISFIEPSDYNYLIVTVSNLRKVANEYAEYRKSEIGGSFKPLVMDVKDIYSQFNYGEPSPVAIRRFVDYMLSKGVDPKHQLLLIGHSISNGDSINYKKELEGMVPTVGYPGSDLLLVTGLAGSSIDNPAIPVGRISAVTESHVRNYLEKVKSYESNANGDISWKKEILHLSGGKSASEIVQLKTALSSLTPVVEGGEVGGMVKAFEKQSVIEVEKVNITPELNNGVGMISYFGHGSTNITDLDMGYVSDATRGYKNKNKYPLMFFNGCGVGNIFKGNLNEDITAGDREPLSFDWMYAKDKGAIAIIANSYYSFLSPSSRYIKELYQRIFSSSATSQLTIGQIQKDIAKQISSESYSEYDVANLHQSVLQGDPSLNLIRSSNPDYKLDASGAITLHSESSNKTIGQSKTLTVAIDISNIGSYSKNQLIPVIARLFYRSGYTEDKRLNVASLSYRDTIFLSLNNSQPLGRIEIGIDPENTIVELSKSNNSGQLIVDWDIAKSQKIYPLGKLVDIIPPILNVSFNNLGLKNDEAIAPNPEIKIILTDDNPLPLDSTLLDVYIKHCGDNNCDFVKLLYSDSRIRFTAVNSNTLQIKYITSTFLTGNYELLINSKDGSGNTISNSYHIKFEILGEPVKHKITVSPNPASEYIRFELEGYELGLYSSMEYVIYDQKGNIIEDKRIDAVNKIWYWIPGTIPAGMYFYKAFLRRDNFSDEIFVGKIIIK